MVCLCAKPQRAGLLAEYSSYASYGSGWSLAENLFDDYCSRDEAPSHVMTKEGDSGCIASRAVGNGALLEEAPAHVMTT